MRTAILAASLALAVVAVGAAPAHADEPCPLNALDCIAVERFSATADATSDALFITSLVLPVGLELGRGLDDDSLRRGLAYGGSVGATALLAGVVKVSVKRSRPYTYSNDPQVQAFTRTARGNKHSFFSGHTSLSFAAATSGGVLHNAVSTDDNSRMILWAAGGALAASTGVFRIRAGKHFPSDVLVGAAVGTAAGIGITMAVAPDAELRWTDGAAFAGGVVVGAAVAALVPMPRDVVLPIGGSGGVIVDGPIGFTPVAMPGGGLGMSLSGTMR